MTNNDTQSNHETPSGVTASESHSSDRKQYKNPPILEAICDIRFYGANRWNTTIPGRFYDYIKDRYPDDPDEQETFQTKFSLGPKGQTEHQTQSIGTRILFNNKETNTKASLSPDGVGAHALKPYRGWQTFRPDVLKNIEAYNKLMEPKGIARIGVRYINKIVMHPDFQATANLSKFFKDHPQSLDIGEEYQTYLAQYIVRKQSVAEIGQDRVVISSSFVDGKSAGFMDCMSTLLDIDVFCSWPDPGIELDRVENYLDLLRDVERKAFESLITDHARSTFDA